MLRALPRLFRARRWFYERANVLCLPPPPPRGCELAFRLVCRGKPRVRVHRWPQWEKWQKLAASEAFGGGCVVALARWARYACILNIAPSRRRVKLVIPCAFAVPVGISEYKSFMRSLVWRTCRMIHMIISMSCCCGGRIERNYLGFYARRRGCDA